MVNYCLLCGGCEGLPILYYCFPSHLPTRKLWADFCGIQIQNYQSLGNPRICSKHFCEDDFIEDDAQKFKILKGSAVPSIGRGEKRKLNEIKTENYQNKKCQTANDPYCSKIARFMGDINIEDLPLSSEQKQYLNDFKIGIDEKKKKIRSCQVANRRLEKRLIALKDTIIKLKKSMININDDSEPIFD